MMRIRLAMTLSLGLALAGCGDTNPEPAAAPVAKTGDETPVASPDATPKAGGPGMSGPGIAASSAPGAKEGGGAAGKTGPTPEIMAGMESKGYRAASLGPDGKPLPAKDPAANTSVGKPGNASKGGAVVLNEDEIKAVNELPDKADREAALAQKICAVNEDADGKPVHLGSMGMPVKEVVKGKTVFLCCKKCVDELKKNPDKYLAKIAK